MYRLPLVAAVLLGFAPLAPAVASATGSNSVAVTTTADTLAKDGRCSLREAIGAVQRHGSYFDCVATTSTTMIELPVATYRLASTLPLAANVFVAGATSSTGAHPTLVGNVTVPASAHVTLFRLVLQGTGHDVAPAVANAGSLTVRGSTITGYTNVGNSAGSGGEAADTAGIANTGSLTVTLSALTHLTAGALFGVGDGAGAVMSAGSLTITNSLLAYDAGAAASAVDVTGGTAAISSTTITRMSTMDSPGGLVLGNAGTLRMSAVTFADNTADGAVIGNSGTATLVRGNLVHNGDSPAIENRAWRGSASLTIERTRIGGNGPGINIDTVGGIDNYGLLRATDVTIDHNFGSMGGGLVNETGAVATLANSTIDSNTGCCEPAEDYSGPGGSGIANLGTLTLRNTTISHNSAGQTQTAFHPASAGVANLAGTTTLENTIVAGNVAEAGAVTPDCAGTISSAGYNLIGSTMGCRLVGSATGLLLNRSALLGTLGYHGGGLPTDVPAIGSPAIDAGNPASPTGSGTSCLPTDERGARRPRDGNGDGLARCDLGAVER